MGVGSDFVVTLLRDFSEIVICATQEKTDEGDL